MAPFRIRVGLWLDPSFRRPALKLGASGLPPVKVGQIIDVECRTGKVDIQPHDTLTTAQQPSCANVPLKFEKRGVKGGRETGGMSGRVAVKGLRRDCAAAQAFKHARSEFERG